MTGGGAHVVKIGWKFRTFRRGSPQDQPSRFGSHSRDPPIGRKCLFSKGPMRSPPRAAARLRTACQGKTSLCRLPPGQHYRAHGGQLVRPGLHGRDCVTVSQMTAVSTEMQDPADALALSATLAVHQGADESRSKTTRFPHSASKKAESRFPTMGDDRALVWRAAQRQEWTFANNPRPDVRLGSSRTASGMWGRRSSGGARKR